MVEEELRPLLRCRQCGLVVLACATCDGLISLDDRVRCRSEEGHDHDTCVAADSGPRPTSRGWGTR
jgi:hypothetical protein